MRQIPLAIGLFFALSALACGPRAIPGLNIELADTPDHRALLKIMEDFRTAYEQKDIDALVALASPRFFEPSGSVGTDDDYNYDGLRNHFVEHFKMVEKCTLDYTLRDVQVTKNEATIDYRYVTRYLMKLPAGDKWQVTDDLNRMKLIKEAGTWKVLSGL